MSGPGLALDRYEGRWTDRSPHREGYLAIRGIQLHYLDWGGPRDSAGKGSPPTLLLLTGAGQTAHVFDDLAPHFTAEFRVLALTRRGTSPSTVADTGYSAAGLMADLLAALDALGVARASLAGHSVAGGEMTWLAAEHPERVEKLVYLDATYDYADRLNLPPNAVSRPELGPADTTLNAVRRWLATSFYGFWTDALETDLRATLDSRGMDVAIRDLAANPAPYVRVRAPALVVVASATVASANPWLDPVRDSEQVVAAQQYLTRVLEPLDRRSLDRVRAELTSARYLSLTAPHHVFISHPDTIVRTMRAFLLPPADRGSPPR